MPQKNTIQIKQTHPSDYLFFYRMAHPFSNFHPSCFVVEGQLFQTAEQYIMWRKAYEFGDTQSAEAILKAHTPAECKKLGRRVKNFDEAQWAGVREQVAFDAVLHKFRDNRKLREFLLDTNDLILVEASPSDRIWGIGYSEQDAWDYRYQWGENLLGKALMRVREQLKNEPKNELKAGSSPYETTP